jgi:hypothetical protein
MIIELSCSKGWAGALAPTGIQRRAQDGRKSVKFAWAWYRTDTDEKLLVACPERLVIVDVYDVGTNMVAERT